MESTQAPISLLGKSSCRRKWDSEMNTCREAAEVVPGCPPLPQQGLFDWFLEPSEITQRMTRFMMCHTGVHLQLRKGEG